MTAKGTTKHRPFRDCVPEEAVEHMRAAHREMRQGFEALFPPKFVEQRNRARKEMLLAFRSMIDAALERLEEHEN
jgi:hypothetical protein